jgi:hypothetical protein
MATTGRHLRGMRRGERALGLVEAIVAAFVMLIIVVAVSSVLVTTLRSQSKASLSERRLAAAEGLFERLKADSEWAGPSGAGCNSMLPTETVKRCSSSYLQARYASDGLIDQTGAARPIRYETSIVLDGIDDPIDRVGTADLDGMRPDYYHATVRVRRQGSTEQWATLTGNIDPPGRQTAGAITINVCQVVRQWDERIPIGSCPGSKEVLLGYPAGGLFGGGSDPHGAADWRAALDRAAPAAGGRGWNMVTYDVRPASGVTIELRRRDGGPARVAGFQPPAGCSSPNQQVVRCVTNSATPIKRVSGLTPGHYNVTMTGFPFGYTAWPLHSIPAGNTAIVEAGRVSRVLQVIRPVVRASLEAPGYNYTVDLRSCDHSTVRAWGTGPCVETIQPYGVSGYLAPASSARARWSHEGAFLGDGVQTVGAGADSITFSQLVPGLYSGRIVTPTQSSIFLTNGAGGPSLDFMWLNPVADGLPGGDAPASGVPTYTRHWCDYDRRVAYLASVGLGSDGGTRTFVDSTDSDNDGDFTETYDLTWYSADASCASGGVGPPAPGSGGGGA